MTDLTTGDIIFGLEPDEHVEIRRVAPFGSKTLIEGVTMTTRREIRRPLSAEELARLVKVRGSEYTYDGNANAFMLGVEAHRIRIAYQYDPLFAVNSSVVDVLPHQVEAVYRYLLPLPRDEEDWKLISSLLGERETLRLEAKRSEQPKQQSMFDS